MNALTEIQKRSKETLAQRHFQINAEILIAVRRLEKLFPQNPGKFEEIIRDYIGHTPDSHVIRRSRGKAAEYLNAALKKQPDPSYEGYTKLLEPHHLSNRMRVAQRYFGVTATVASLLCRLLDYQRPHLTK